MTGGGPMVCIWDCGGPKGPEGTQPQMLEGHEDNLTAVAYQSRGYLLASAATDVVPNPPVVGYDVDGRFEAVHPLSVLQPRAGLSIGLFDR